MQCTRRDGDGGKGDLRPTDIGDPDYFHKVVDCQWACPAHTPVPEYIRLIAAGRYTDAYMVNWESNVFPGILGRTCDRPCEPACRRGRVEEAQAEKPEPVAICRLKRVAADYKDDITRAPAAAGRARRNGKRVACVGAGPASLTVARDLAPLGYEVVVFDGDTQAGGMIRSQIPRFRLPEEVIDEETGYVLKLGVEFRGGTRVDSMQARCSPSGWDAVFVGSGAPRGRDLSIPGRSEAAAHIHIGIDWLSSVSFGHVTEIGKRVIVLGGGNTAMDCCRSSKRLGGSDVKVIVRSPFEEMKASPWEKEDAIHEGIPILDCLVPKAFLHDNGRLTGMSFDKVRAVRDAKGRRQLVSTGEPEQVFECDDVLVAVGQENAFPWIERDAGIDVRRMGHAGARPGDAAVEPAARLLRRRRRARPEEHHLGRRPGPRGRDLDRQVPPRRGREPSGPPPGVTLVSQKMGIHEWSYDNDVTAGPAQQGAVARRQRSRCRASRSRSSSASTSPTAWKEAQRCLNCDVQTVFATSQCIECDACVDICPTDCITFTANGDGGRPAHAPARAGASSRAGALRLRRA